jgi:hypothetical protein
MTYLLSFGQHFGAQSRKVDDNNVGTGIAGKNKTNPNTV